MKTLTISLAALAMMALPAALDAQANTNVNNTIGVSATVGKAFRWTIGQDLLFGTVIPEGDGSTAALTVPASQAAADADGRQAGYVALFMNSATNVTVDAPTSLDGSGTNTLNVSFVCGVGSDNSGTLDVQASGACADAAVLNLTLSGSGSETVYIFFGGTLATADLEAAMADTYTGTITLTAVQP